ncbi:MFS transporter [Kitasatospora cineracea]|uniref:Putative MFS family arabinose efflux permease n=1 Tax=Kitasatospora cineracea TaxID=88074 RepID=A0A8G1UR89_9ACTN|nr:MFS transporter [Kitasatospora cineracea]ROR46344.1 putative MFS family arabinose efflux permease [Kitasatospora cineracea]
MPASLPADAPAPAPAPDQVLTDVPAPDPVLARPRLTVTLLMAGSCLPILGAVLIAPVVPKLQDHFASVSGVDALAPMALTVPALSLAVMAPFAGAIIDRLGRHRLLVIATVLYTIVGTAPLWLDSLPAIIASRALVGVAESAIMTCCTTLIGDYWSGKQREKYLALQAICSAVSATAFFALGGAAGSAGWRAPFWAYAVGLLLAPLLATVLRPAARRTDNAPATVALTPFAPLLRRLLAPCALTFFGAIVFYTIPVETSFLLKDLGTEAPATIGLCTAIASAATVAGAAAFTRLTDHAERLLPWTLALCAAGFGIIALAGNVPLLVVGAVVNCLGTGMLLPTLINRTVALLTPANRGRGTGLWNTAFFLGEFVCPLLLLAAAKPAGDLAGAVGVLGLVTLAIAAGLAVARSRRGEIPRAVENAHA